MARVEILVSLKNEILKKFKEESKIIFKLMFSSQDNHSKGKLLGSIGGILIIVAEFVSKYTSGHFKDQRGKSS